MSEHLDTSSSGARSGLVLGAGAVLFWSFGSSLVFLGAKAAGTWPFVAGASLTGGLLQMIFRRVHRGELRTALRLPWRLWAAPVLCFVVYGLVWPWALAASSPGQVVGVSLINYLWPVLTVVFSAWWVPGVRMGPRTLLALALSVAGLVCANLTPIRGFIRAGTGAEGSSVGRLLPYALALAAALTWGIYSAVLIRWRPWARHYATSPLGFILIGLVATLAAGLSHGGPVKFTPATTGWILAYGAGPSAAGYLLWETALARAKVQSLSLIASVTPVLSTLLLCLILRRIPGAELVLAALLVSGGVVLSMGE